MVFLKCNLIWLNIFEGIIGVILFIDKVSFCMVDMIFFCLVGKRSCNRLLMIF